jgi:hypothetical protein
MRLFRRNNHPRNPLPLVRIRKGTGHCIRPPRGEFRRNPVAVLLAQLIGKPLCMDGGAERSVPSSKKATPVKAWPSFWLIGHIRAELSQCGLDTTARHLNEVIFGFQKYLTREMIVGLRCQERSFKRQGLWV